MQFKNDITTKQTDCRIASNFVVVRVELWQSSPQNLGNPLWKYLKIFSWTIFFQVFLLKLELCRYTSDKRRSCLLSRLPKLKKKMDRWK